MDDPTGAVVEPAASDRGVVIEAQVPAGTMQTVRAALPAGPVRDLEARRVLAAVLEAVAREATRLHVRAVRGDGALAVAVASEPSA